MNRAFSNSRQKKEPFLFVEVVEEACNLDTLENWKSNHKQKKLELKNKNWLLVSALNSDRQRYIYVNFFTTTFVFRIAYRTKINAFSHI